MKIVWTAGWVESVDKWMMVTTLGWCSCGQQPRVVTFIHLTSAPNPMVGPRQLWTAGWVEPCDKWVMVTILTILWWWPYSQQPKMLRMVTIIHLSEAPNPRIGHPTLHQPRKGPPYTIASFVPFLKGEGGGGQKSLPGRVPRIHMLKLRKST